MAINNLRTVENGFCERKVPWGSNELSNFLPHHINPKNSKQSCLRFHSFKCWRFFQITNNSSVCVPLLSQHGTAYSNRQRCLHKYKSESFQKVPLLSTIREQLWVATDESTGLTTAEWDNESSSASVLGWLELYHECWEHQEPSSGSWWDNRDT